MLVKVEQFAYKDIHRYHACEKLLFW